MSTIVTAAAMGIGRAIALKLAGEGHNLVLVDRAETELQKTCQAARDLGAKVEMVTGSVTDKDIVVNSIEAAIVAFGRITGLSHNVGIHRTGDVVSTTDEIWDEVMNANLKSAFTFARAALPELIRTKGAIVMMASVQGLASERNVAAYSTSKFALIGLTSSIAVDYAQYGVRANAVAPGTVDTPNMRASVARSNDPNSLLHTVNAMHPLGRVGRSDEIAELVSFLLSDKASFITGETIRIDGGLLSRIS